MGPRMDVGDKKEDLEGGKMRLGARLVLSHFGRAQQIFRLKDGGGRRVDLEEIMG